MVLAIGIVNKCAKFGDDILTRYRLGGVGVSFQHFRVSKVVTTAHARKRISY